MSFSLLNLLSTDTNSLENKIDKTFNHHYANLSNEIPIDPNIDTSLEHETLSITDEFSERAKVIFKQLALADKQFIAKSKANYENQSKRLSEKLVQATQNTLTLKEFSKVKDNIKAWFLVNIIKKQTNPLESFFPEKVLGNAEARPFIMESARRVFILTNDSDEHISELVSLFSEDEFEHVLREALIGQSIPSECLASKLVKQASKKYPEEFKQYKQVLVNALATYQDNYMLNIKVPSGIPKEIWNVVCQQAKEINMEMWNNPEEFGEVEATLNSKEDQVQQSDQAISSAIRNYLANNNNIDKKTIKALSTEEERIINLIQAAAMQKLEEKMQEMKHCNFR